MRTALFIKLLFLSLLAHSQTVVTWEDLKFKSTSEKWNEKEQSVYIVPVFSEKTKKLEGKKIEITGYMLSIDLKENYYVLATQKLEPSIYGCKAIPSLDGVIDVCLSLKTTPKHNAKITITGTLIINKNDLTKLSYIIEDAKIVNN